MEEQIQELTETPPPEPVRHAGGPIPADADFFAEVPAEIGELVSADSTLRQGKSAMSANARLAVATATALVIYIAGRYGTALLVPGWAGPMTTWISAGVGLLVGVGAWLALRFRHTCTYVGMDGVALITLAGGRGGRTKQELLVFENADNLRSGETRQYYNGIYTGTTYRFIWADRGGQKMLKLSGQYRSKEGTPKDKSPYHFARSAEAAWSNHLLLRMQAELEEKGSVEFQVGKRRAIRVGPGFLELDWDGTTARCEVDEIESLGIREGTFQIRHRDATWFGRKGKFKFKYADMANARLFILALERFLGYQFG